MSDSAESLGPNKAAARRMDALVRAVGGPSEASRITGKTRTTINNWRRKGSADLLDILPLIKATGASLDWLATGLGNPPSGVTIEPALSSVQSGGLVKLTTLTQTASSGEHVLGLSPQVISELGVPIDALAAAPVSDGGMAPLIRRGGVVLVDTRPNQPLGELVLVCGPKPFVRRCAVDGLGHTILIADAMPSWSLPPDQIDSIVLRPVVWYGGAV